MLWVRKILVQAAALASAVLILPCGPAQAAVELSLYSRELGSQFPHGFVRIEGTLDRGGERIDASYGFTATLVSPAILFGSVRGKVEPVGEGYIRSSDPHFALTLTDSEYDNVMAAVVRWQALRQPSYNLNRRNCVHFVADVAASLGMAAEVPRGMARRPRAFLDSLVRTNRAWLQQRAARILREPSEEREERRGRDPEADGA
ncbi:hypothetical protein [Allosphingosinicella sp.]|jgi:hypothetical protein|uniref:hypothetical protein n=1 Tax=Allosphingosinicella sp. TaxID=2823234 RepID=UPI003D760A9C